MLLNYYRGTSVYHTILVHMYSSNLITIITNFDHQVKQFLVFTFSKEATSVTDTNSGYHYRNCIVF